MSDPFHLEAVQTHQDHLVTMIGMTDRHRCMSFDLWPSEHPALQKAWAELEKQVDIAVRCVMSDIVDTNVPNDISGLPRGAIKPCRICGAVVFEDDPGVVCVGASYYCPEHAPQR